MEGERVFLVYMDKYKTVYKINFSFIIDIKLDLKLMEFVCNGFMKNYEIQHRRFEKSLRKIIINVSIILYS